MALGLVDQGGLQGLDLAVDRVDRVAHPKAHVGGDLVVARACGMEPAGKHRPISSVSRASMFIWTSSNAGSKWKAPDAISAEI